MRFGNSVEQRANFCLCSMIMLDAKLRLSNVLRSAAALTTGIVIAVGTAGPVTAGLEERDVKNGQPATSGGTYERIGQVDGGGLFFRSAFSRDGSEFITRKDQVVRVWDAHTLRPLTQPLVHEHLRCCRLCSDGKTVLTGGGKEVCLWDVSASKLRWAVNVTQESLDYADASPDGAQFVTIGSEDLKTVKIWRAGEKRAPIPLHHDRDVTSAEFDPTGARIITHEFGRSFRVWAADTGRAVCQPIPSDNDAITPDRGQLDPSGRLFVLPQKHGFTEVELATGKVVVHVEFDDWTHTDSVRFSGDGAEIAVSFFEDLEPGPIRVYDATTGRLLHEFGGHLIDCQVGPRGLFALCTPIRRAPTDVPQLWNLATGTQVQSFPQTGFTAEMDFSGRTILIESELGVTTVWHLRHHAPTTHSGNSE